MKILHILRTEADETVKDIVASTTNGDQSKTAELYNGQPVRRIKTVGLPASRASPWRE